MGTMIQQLNFGETDYRGVQFAAFHRDLKGCNDLLAITQPQAITAIHRGYLEAGADIVCTNTFNANSVSMADYDLVDQVRAINLAGVACARKAVDDFRAARSAAGQSPPQGVRPFVSSSPARSAPRIVPPRSRRMSTTLVIGQ